TRPCDCQKTDPCTMGMTVAEDFLTEREILSCFLQIFTNPVQFRMRYCAKKGRSGASSNRSANAKHAADPSAAPYVFEDFEAAIELFDESAESGSFGAIEPSAL